MARIGTRAISAQSKRWLITLVVLNIIVMVCGQVEGAFFGVLVARLSYDIVNVKTNNANIDTLDLVMAGSDLQAGVIAKTANLPKNGVSVHDPLWKKKGFARQRGLREYFFSY